MKTNMRRVSLRVTAQTLYNLERLRKMGELKSLGRVVDKLTREKMVALHGDHLREPTKKIHHFRDATKMDRTKEKGAGRQDRNLARLTAYRKGHGRGCLAEVAALAGAPVTEELLLGVLTGGGQLPAAQWQQVGRALDALEQGGGHE